MVTPFSTVRKPFVQRRLREQLLGQESLTSFSSVYVAKPKSQQILARHNATGATQKDKPACSSKRHPLAFCLQTELLRAAEHAASSVPKPELLPSISVQNLSDLASTTTFVYTLRAAKAMGHTAFKRLDHISNPVQIKKMLTALNKDACTRCMSVLIPGATCQLIPKFSSCTRLNNKRLFKKKTKCPCIFRKCFFCGWHQAVAWKRPDICSENILISKPSVEHVHFPLSSCIKSKKQKKLLADTALFQTSLVNKEKKSTTTRGERRHKRCERPQAHSTTATAHMPCVNGESSVLSILDSFFSSHGI